MSFHKDVHTFDCNLEGAFQACRFAFNEMQMLVKKDADQSFEASEKLRMGFANPAKLEVNLAASGAKTTVAVNSSNFGFGPMQGGHLKGVAEALLHRRTRGFVSASLMTVVLLLNEWSAFSAS